MIPTTFRYAVKTLGKALDPTCSSPDVSCVHAALAASRMRWQPESQLGPVHRSNCARGAGLVCSSCRAHCDLEHSSRSRRGAPAPPPAPPCAAAGGAPDRPAAVDGAAAAGAQYRGHSAALSIQRAVRRGSAGAAACAAQCRGVRMQQLQMQHSVQVQRQRADACKHPGSDCTGQRQRQRLCWVAGTAPRHVRPHLRCDRRVLLNIPQESAAGGRGRLVCQPKRHPLLLPDRARLQQHVSAGGARPRGCCAAAARVAHGSCFVPAAPVAALHACGCRQRTLAVRALSTLAPASPRPTGLTLRLARSWRASCGRPLPSATRTC